MSVKTDNKIFLWGEKFFHSWWYIALVTLIGSIGFVFRFELITIYIIVSIAAVSWVLCEDMLPSFIAMCIISMTPLKRYGETGYFTDIYYVAVILGLALIIRLFFHRPELRTGRFFIPTLAVAIAITLGGLPQLNAQKFFSMPSIYYVAALGIGMVIINVILESTLPEGKTYTDFFAKMTAGIGLMGIAMIISAYAETFEIIQSGSREFVRYFQWGNNLSNMLLITMPFSFYMSLKNGKFSWAYFVLGILQFFALLLSLSRGGVIFGTLEFLVCIVLTLVFAKEKRKIYLFSAVLLTGLAALLLFLFLSPVIKSLGDSLTVSSDEARVKLYLLAWENFKKYPFFGTGLQYDGGLYYRPQPFCIYWYHSTIFQILGSLGIMGVIAYGIQSFYRLKALARVKDFFNIFTAVAIGGFAAYSIVNVGYFVPLPCMAILIQIFIILDRNNAYILSGRK